MAKKKTKDKLVSATYLIPEKLKEEIEKQAGEENVSAGHVVRQILRKDLGRDQDSEANAKVR